MTASCPTGGARPPVTPFIADRSSLMHNLAQELARARHADRLARSERAARAVHLRAARRAARRAEAARRQAQASASAAHHAALRLAEAG